METVDIQTIERLSYELDKSCQIQPEEEPNLIAETAIDQGYVTEVPDDIIVNRSFEIQSPLVIIEPALMALSQDPNLQPEVQCLVSQVISIKEEQAVMKRRQEQIKDELNWVKEKLLASEIQHKDMIALSREMRVNLRIQKLLNCLSYVSTHCRLAVLICNGTSHPLHNPASWEDNSAIKSLKHMPIEINSNHFDDFVVIRESHYSRVFKGIFTYKLLHLRLWVGYYVAEDNHYFSLAITNENPGHSIGDMYEQFKEHPDSYDVVNVDDKSGMDMSGAVVHKNYRAQAEMIPGAFQATVKVEIEELYEPIK